MRLFLRALRRLSVDHDWRATIWMRDPETAPSLTLPRRLRDRVGLAGPADGSEAQFLASALLRWPRPAGPPPHRRWCCARWRAARCRWSRGCRSTRRRCATVSSASCSSLATRTPSRASSSAWSPTPTCRPPGRAHSRGPPRARVDPRGGRPRGALRHGGRPSARHRRRSPRSASGCRRATSCTWTCTCTPTIPPTAPRRWTPCWRPPRGSAWTRSRSPTTTRSRGPSRPGTRRTAGSRSSWPRRSRPPTRAR